MYGCACIGVRARALLLLYNCCLCAGVVWIRHDVQEQSVSLLVFSEMEAYPIYFGVAVLRLDFLCSY